MFNNPLLSAGCSEQFRPRFCWKVRLMHQFRSRECVLILGTRLCDSTCKIIFLSFRILVKFNLGFPPFVGDGRLSCDILEAWYRLYISCTPCLLFDGAQPREKVQMADPKFQADCRPQSLWVTGCCGSLLCVPGSGAERPQKCVLKGNEEGREKMQS